jgi:hypothetical protein
MFYFILLLSLYFFIGFISDLFLNYLSRQSYSPSTIKALKIYFDRKNIKSAHLRHFISAANAGFTVLSAIIVVMLLSQLLFGFFHPKTIHELWRFIIIAFIIGYAYDILIYKIQLFGNTLNPYYTLAGAGLWGAMAIVFSVLVTYIVYINFFLQKKSSIY